MLEAAISSPRLLAAGPALNSPHREVVRDAPDDRLTQSRERQMPGGSKDVARRLWDVWNSRELGKLGELVADDHVNHDPNNPNDLVGVDGYRELITMYTTMFPDLKFHIREMVADGDVVCSRWIAHGTHAGQGFGLTPTNSAMESTGISWQRVRDGKIVETWVERDGLGLARAVGMVPAG